MNSAAVAAEARMVAVGSADGYPAVWRRASGGAWRLVSSLSQVSADPDLAGLTAVTHGPDGWLAVGPGPLVLTSADGTNMAAPRSASTPGPGRRVGRRRPPAAAAGT